jgi:hypothetical protein
MGLAAIDDQDNVARPQRLQAPRSGGVAALRELAADRGDARKARRSESRAFEAQLYQRGDARLANELRLKRRCRGGEQGRRPRGATVLEGEQLAEARARRRGSV